MATWLITGCSAGLGRELARAVLARGDQAVITARDARDVADLAGTAGGRALALPLDVTSPQQAQAAVTAAAGRFGGIDVLVNNAGVGYFAAVEEGDEQEVRRMFEVNVFGLAALTRAVLPGMRARRSGTIVNVSSIAGLRSFPAVGYYSAAKFAVEGLSEALAQEVRPLGIRVVLVEPGPLRTGWHGHSARETRPGAEIADYAATAGAARARLRDSAGREPGDPARAAWAIITAVTAASPPHRLLLGSAACHMALDKLTSLHAEITAWEDLSRSTDFPPAPDSPPGTPSTS